MDKSFDEDSVSLAPASKRRKVDISGLDDVMSRQRNWISKGRSDQAVSVTWRPATESHHATKRWLTNVDCQLRFSFNPLGLKFLKPDDTLECWKDWRRHPFGVFAMDLGSDGVCAINAMIRHWLLNAELWGDRAHGNNCDFELLLSRRGKKAFWLCMLVVWNLPFGPLKARIQCKLSFRGGVVLRFSRASTLSTRPETGQINFENDFS